jgi:hypothetical protein
MYEISSESDIIEKNNIEEDIKTSLINKKINIYDNDNENDNDIDIQGYKESGTDNNRFNVSSDRLIANQPKVINIDLSDKIQEMFSFNISNNNNSTQIKNNLEQKPKTKTKKEIIYSYESKKMKKDKNKENEDEKGKENKTVENNEDSRNVTQMGQINNMNPKNTNRYLPINSNSNSNEKKKNKLPIIRNKSKKNKKFVNININLKEIKNNNKPISHNKNDKIEQNLKGNKEIKQRESIIDSNDPNYLLYSNIALGVPQNVKESYKLLKNKTKIKKKNKDVKSPDNDRKVEFLRTFDEENE